MGLFQVAMAKAGTTRRRLARLGLALALVSLFPLAVLIVRETDGLPASLCVFRLALGWPCPLCGLTHAFAMAAQGRCALAFDYNPLWPLAAGSVLIGACLNVIDAVDGRHRARDFMDRMLRRPLIVSAILLAFEAWRVLR